MKHYQNYQRTGNPLGKFNGDRKALREAIRKINIKHVGCLIGGCLNKHYALGYCHNHWEKNRLYNNPLGRWHKCFIEGCHYKTKNNKYCRRHSLRNKQGRSMNLSIKYTLKGKRNPRWNGGVSDYPNHYEFKKNRLVVLERAKGLCEICGNKGKHIHHKDGSKVNHDIDNLIMLCIKCHGLIHRGRNNHTSKFIRLYGSTLQEIANKLNKSIMYVYYKHRNKKLGIMLDKNKSPEYT